MKHSNVPGCTSAASCESKRNFAPKVFTALFFLTLCFAFSAFSQSSTDRPSCNLVGKLEVRSQNGTSGLRGLTSEIVVTAEIFNADASTNFAYSFDNNSSGAVIKTYGPRSYNAATKTTTQQVVLTPGNAAGKGFNLKLVATNPGGGACTCSKSVSVIN